MAVFLTINYKEVHNVLSVSEDMILTTCFSSAFQTLQGPSNCLTELKVINAGATLHPRGRKGTGVEKKASRLAAENKAALAQFHNETISAVQTDLCIIITKCQTYIYRTGVMSAWQFRLRNFASIIMLH